VLWLLEYYIRNEGLMINGSNEGIELEIPLDFLTPGKNYTMTGFEDGDLQVGILLYQLVSGEDTAGAGTDNNDVIFHREWFLS
jgi:hypothetical protein